MATQFNHWVLGMELIVCLTKSIRKCKPLFSWFHLETLHLWGRHLPISMVSLLICNLHRHLSLSPSASLLHIQFTQTHTISSIFITNYVSPECTLRDWLKLSRLSFLKQWFRHNSFHKHLITQTPTLCLSLSHIYTHTHRLCPWAVQNHGNWTDIPTVY